MRYILIFIQCQRTGEAYQLIVALCIYEKYTCVPVKYGKGYDELTRRVLYCIAISQRPISFLYWEYTVFHRCEPQNMVQVSRIKSICQRDVCCFFSCFLMFNIFQSTPSRDMSLNMSFGYNRCIMSTIIASRAVYWTSRPCFLMMTHSLCIQLFCTFTGSLS